MSCFILKPLKVLLAHNFKSDSHWCPPTKTPSQGHLTQRVLAAFEKLWYFEIWSVVWTSPTLIDHDYSWNVLLYRLLYCLRQSSAFLPHVSGEFRLDLSWWRLRWNFLHNNSGYFLCDSMNSHMHLYCWQSHCQYCFLDWWYCQNPSMFFVVSIVQQATPSGSCPICLRVCSGLHANPAAQINAHWISMCTIGNHMTVLK